MRPIREVHTFYLAEEFNMNLHALESIGSVNIEDRRHLPSHLLRTHSILALPK
jgi:hypothetical protein